ncbi:MAG: hypothetical protein QM820_09040 [Minicystis sp.]
MSDKGCAAASEKRMRPLATVSVAFTSVVAEKLGKMASSSVSVET